MLLALLLAMFCQVNASNIYVKSNSTGNGTSWDSAFGSLSDAIASAKAGDEIWVAKGTYTPTNTADRNVSFHIPSGVKVLGGFQGTETAANQRVAEQNKTILSGEIGQAGTADNSYTVVTFTTANNETVLDGFTITAGNANSEKGEANPSKCGGGMYINGENGASLPMIVNCSFIANLGRDGAAVYNNGRSGNSSPTFTNCKFENNEAGLDGGAVYNDGRMSGKSNPTFTKCSFTRNMGTYGGAICNANEAGSCNLTLNECTFTENAAYLRGGAVFSMNGDEKCYLEFSNCSFESNFPDDQNMIFTSTSGRTDAYKIAGTNP